MLDAMRWRAQRPDLMCVRRAAHHNVAGLCLAAGRAAIHEALAFFCARRRRLERSDAARAIVVCRAILH